MLGKVSVVTCALVLLISFSWSGAQAQGIVPSSNISGTLDTEVQVLRAQLEVMKQYDQRLLETVGWSLTIGITVLAAILGIGYLANIRIYENDKATLMRELSNYIDERRLAHEKRLEDVLESRISEIKGLLEERLVIQDQVVEGDIGAIEGKVNQLKIEIRGDLFVIRYDALLTEARLAVQINKPEKAVASYVAALDLIVREERSELYASPILKEISDALETYELSLYVTEVTELNRLLNKLSDDYQLQTGPIKDKLRNIPTKRVTY